MQRQRDKDLARGARRQVQRIGQGARRGGVGVLDGLGSGQAAVAQVVVHQRRRRRRRARPSRPAGSGDARGSRPPPSRRRVHREPAERREAARPTQELRGRVDLEGAQGEEEGRLQGAIAQVLEPVADDDPRGARFAHGEGRDRKFERRIAGRPAQAGDGQPALGEGLLERDIRPGEQALARPQERLERRRRRARSPPGPPRRSGTRAHRRRRRPPSRRTARRRCRAGSCRGGPRRPARGRGHRASSPRPAAAGRARRGPAPVRPQQGAGAGSAPRPRARRAGRGCPAGRAARRANPSAAVQARLQVDSPRARGPAASPARGR